MGSACMTGQRRSGCSGLLYQTIREGLPTEPTDLYGKNAAVNAILSFYAEKAALLNIDMEIAFSIHDTTLIPESEFCALLGNLLENALAHSESSMPVELIVTNDGPSVTFHVIDHGKGIAESSLPDIFSGKYDGSLSSDTKRGMGIGLSICRTIIQAHDGTITARNHDDGAEFSFSLPIS